MRVLDLFSGIGGFSLGLERAGMRTVAFCEIEPYCRAVLRKHWPETRIHDDIKFMDCAIAADVVCGGPPCQATSVAAAISGNRTGATMWPWMFRVADLVRPAWVIVEQPCGNAAWEDQVKDDLARIGYHSARFERSAGSFGAPHERRRVFIIANAVRKRCEEVARLSRSSPSVQVAWPAPPRGAWRSPRSGNRGMDDGFSDWVDRLRSLGNALVPQIAEMIGRAIMEVAA